MLVSKQQWTKHGLVLIQGHLMSKQRHDVHASSAAPKLNLSVGQRAPLKHACAPTYTLLKHFDVFNTDTNPSRTSEMPACLSRQILYHDTGQDCDLGLYIIQDAVVREI
jgi:hypothetical protein